MTTQYADFISKQNENNSLRSEIDPIDLVEYSTDTKKHLYGAHCAHVECEGEDDDYAEHLDKAETSHGKDQESGAYKKFDTLHKNSQRGLKGALKHHASGGKNMEYDSHHMKTLDGMDAALRHDSDYED